MDKLKFPIVQGENTGFPSSTEDRKCPVCKLKNISNEDEHVFIHGGAFLLSEETENGTQPFQLVDNLHAFLYMDWDSGEKDIYAELELASEVKKGQYSFRFCSTNCLRVFLNTCVDNLESRINVHKNA
jgi:hypothetical protein